MNYDRFFRFAFIIGALTLTFVWGAVAVRMKVFPYRFITKIEAGIVALRKMEKTELPQHVIALAPEATSVDPVETLTDTPPGDLILMSGGFFFRQDLCPKFGCIAWIMKRDGTVLHTWEYDPDALFDKDKLAGFTGYAGAQNMNVQGVDLDRDGNLIVTFQGRNIFPYQVGLGKFSWDGQLDWLRIDRSHHWPTVGPDGRIYTPMARITKDEKVVGDTREPLKCKYGAVFQEGVRILSPDGKVLKEFWMRDVVRDSDMQGLSYSVRDDCDPFHVNGIDLLNAAAAARIPGAEPGDLVVSLRSSSSVVIMSSEDGHIEHVLNGPMVAQHSPRVLPDGEIAMFDNLGGLETEKGTRILAIDPADGSTRTLFPRDKARPGADLDSIAQGAVNFSADGRYGLVAETLGGRVFEFDTVTGEPTWEYRSVSDLTPYYAYIGKPKPGPNFGRMQTQGADYVPGEVYTRLGL